MALEIPLNESEKLNFLLKTRHGKSPGPDGMPCEFC